MALAVFSHPDCRRHDLGPWHPERPPLLDAVDKALADPALAGADGAAYREVYEARTPPRLAAHRPQLVMFSAGFDAHRDDPLAGLNLEAEDFAWITRETARIATRHADGRMVSTLEGGYHLPALRDSVRAHLIALAEAGHA
jgi:acetoin utilization deacetylase AcuC-like enzyme